MLVSGQLLVDVVGVRSRGEVLAHTLVNRVRVRGRVRVRLTVRIRARARARVR